METLDEVPGTGDGDDGILVEDRTKSIVITGPILEGSDENSIEFDKSSLRPLVHYLTTRLDALERER